MAMGRASEKDLELAHGYCLKVLIEEIEAYRSGQVPDPHTGKPKRVPASLLAELSRLLKVNGIDRPGRDPGDMDDLLVDELEEFDLTNHSPFRPSETDNSPLIDKPAHDSFDHAEERQSHLENQLTAYCPSCKTRKPREDFSKNQSRHNGLQALCKECLKQKREAAKATT